MEDHSLENVLGDRIIHDVQGVNTVKKKQKKDQLCVNK